MASARSSYAEQVWVCHTHRMTGRSSQAAELDARARARGLADLGVCENLPIGLLARVRRWWWRHVRRHHGEVCHGCGRPVHLYWQCADDLWSETTVGRQGLLCVTCFDDWCPYDLRWSAERSGGRA